MHADSAFESTEFCYSALMYSSRKATNQPTYGCRTGTRTFAGRIKSVQISSSAEICKLSQARIIYEFDIQAFLCLLGMPPQR